jgi:hypothetical protein
MPHTAFYEEYSLGTWLDWSCVWYARKYWRFLTGYPYAQSQGLMQVSPASVLSDFDTYGQIIFNPYTGSDTGTSTLPILVRPSCCGMVPVCSYRVFQSRVWISKLIDADPILSVMRCWHGTQVRRRVSTIRIRRSNLLITCTESWLLGCGWIWKWRRYVQIDAEKTSG